MPWSFNEQNRPDIIFRNIDEPEHAAIRKLCDECDLVTKLCLNGKFQPDLEIIFSQLACVAAQLTADMDAGRHKYCAHKLALLYHAAVHLARLRDAELEGRIRQHFEDVKIATEEPNFSQLPPRLVEWVRATCAAVHERVAPQPRQLFAANAPRLAAFLSPPRAEDALRRLQSSSVG